MKTTVYIIGYDGDRWLPDCVGTLSEASSERIDLVIIDNYKNPCLAGLDLSAFNAQVVKTPRKMGFADAHNFGVIAAPPKTETAVMLNQDTKSREGWLDRCVECFAKDEKLGVMSPATRTYEDEGWDEAFLQCAKANNEFDEGRTDPGDPSDGEYLEVPVVTGAAMMVRVKPMLEHGLFDPVFGSYYEDYDFCRRMSRNGWKNGICPSAFIHHFSGSATTTDEARRRRMRLIKRNRIIERLRLAGASRAGVLLTHLLADLPRSLARGLVGTASSQPMGVTIGAYWDLLKLLSRMRSEARDEAAWRDYLHSVEWPTA